MRATSSADLWLAPDSQVHRDVWGKLKTNQNIVRAETQQTGSELSGYWRESAIIVAEENMININIVEVISKEINAVL